MNEAIKTDCSYFAAANGFSGFRSNFGNIFAPNKLDRLFIIKGGPGTGKSTLMRRIKDIYKDHARTTSILCSSDPTSLDGIILEGENVKIGVADGTPPHVIEPEHPGLTGEIINLGDGFNFEKLHGHKEAILLLSENKKRYYKSSYSSLKLAGDIYRYIYNISLEYGIYKKADCQINNLIKDEINCKNTFLTSDFLIGAFCMSGYQRINTKRMNKRLVTVNGDGISEYIFMSLLKKSLIEKCISHIVFPSAYATDVPDAIETETSFYSITDTSESLVDTTAYVDKIFTYERLKNAFHTFREMAQISLVKASKAHLDLETIYSASMSFDKNEAKFTEITNKINQLIDK